MKIAALPKRFVATSQKTRPYHTALSKPTVCYAKKKIFLHHFFSYFLDLDVLFESSCHHLLAVEASFLLE